MNTETRRLLTAVLVAGMVASLQARAAIAASAARHRAASNSSHPGQTSDTKSSRSGSKVATLDIRVSLRSGQPKELEPAYRFLWSHWTEQQPARVTVTFYGIDAGVVYIVTIRRGARGIWRIEEHRRDYAARARSEQPAILVQSARQIRTAESPDAGFLLELVGPSGEVKRLFAVENWPRQ